MRPLSTPESQFLALLRYGAGFRQPDPAEESALFGDSLAWEAVYAIAQEQGMVGVVTDGIGCLKGPAAPVEDDIRLDPYLGDLVVIERRCGVLDTFIPKLFGYMAGAGLKPVLVKGQAVARVYPTPSHRECGDIDIFLSPKEYEAARALLLPRAKRVVEDTPEILHVGMFFGNVEVELHGAVSTLMSPRLDRRLAALYAVAMKEAAESVPPPSVAFDGGDVPTFPRDFNALYIFVHFLHHYWSRGVGFRQLFDWALLLQRTQPDPEVLRSWLRDLHLLRVWEVFAGFVVEHFGADPARIPLYRKVFRRKNRRIARYIFRCGNFGKSAPKRSRDKGAEGYMERKVRSFFQLVVADRLRHLRVFPLESLRFFIGASGYGLGRLRKGE